MITEQIQEPKRIGTILTHSDNWKVPSSWESWDFLDMVNCPSFDDWKAKAPIVDRECPKCGRVEQWDAISKSAMKNLVCETCLTDYESNKCNPEQSKEIEQKIIDNIPPLYRETDRVRLEKEHSAAQVRDALKWEKTETGHGLIFIGDSRKGKTRTLCLLIEKLIRQGIKIKTYFHGGFYDELIEVIRSDKAYRKWKSEIIQIDVLVIDDLFAEKLTERGEASLFEILDARICNKKPTLLTTQVTKKEAKERFHSNARHEAFFARIYEFFQMVRCGKYGQEDLNI